ncbi:hypothetical protein DTO212C5_7606 [Paecilomyces variotii]|nr:hypothetical protein DTO212C5_7606 [Paecilomyces variotii]
MCAFKVSTPDESPRFLSLISYPCTGSNLLLRILNLPDQPDLETENKGGYYFLPALKLRKDMGLFERPYSSWGKAEIEEVKNCFQACIEELQKDWEFAKGTGKMLFIKEHAPFLIDPVFQSNLGNCSHDVGAMLLSSKVTCSAIATEESDIQKLSHTLLLNPTVLPDNFLRCMFPTFLIRNPILSFPSHYRAMRDSWRPSEEENGGRGYQEFNMTLCWSRLMYGWYSHLAEQVEGGHNGNGRPIVLDADDIITNPEVVIRYCDIVGLNSSKLRFSWELIKEEELAQMDPEERRMRDTLLASSQIIPGKVSTGLNIDDEAKKWRQDFGEAQAAELERYVKASLPDYEYLRLKRLTVLP